MVRHALRGAGTFPASPTSATISASSSRTSVSLQFARMTPRRSASATSSGSGFAGSIRTHSSRRARSRYRGASFAKAGKAENALSASPEKLRSM